VNSKEVLGEALMADGHTSKRGFAQMDAEKQREIASKGGRAAHEKGTAHKFTPEEAREAGRKGGERSRGRHSEARQSASPGGQGGQPEPVSGQAADGGVQPDQTDGSLKVGETDQQ
jgi:general stress protein YciG